MKNANTQCAVPPSAVWTGTYYSFRISVLIRRLYLTSYITIIWWHVLRANETIFTFSLKALATVIHQARLTSVDDGLLIYERPGGGVSTHLEWRISEGIAGKYKGPGETQNPLLTAPPGFSLEEHYYVERSCLMWLDTKLYGHLQQTMFLLRFFNKITQESSTNQTKQLQLGLSKPMDVWWRVWPRCLLEYYMVSYKWKMEFKRIRGIKYVLFDITCYTWIHGEIFKLLHLRAH